MLNIVLINLLIVIIYMSFWYIVALKLKRNDVVDVAWGLGFIAAALSTLYQSELIDDRSVLIMALVSVWGFRLSGQLFVRNAKQQEDRRYAKLRKKWGKDVIWKSYFYIFIAQGFLVILIGIPVFMGLSSPGNREVTLLDSFGIGLFLIGLILETIADFQLFNFKRTNGDGKILTSGLRRFSRHPNYFGEILIWWGFFLLALPLSYGWISAVGPLTLTLLIRYFSGVPPAEERLRTNLLYKEYTRTVNAIIPIPWKIWKG